MQTSTSTLVTNMDTATQLQFITAYRELGRIPTELVADYVTVKAMVNVNTYERSTVLANNFVLDYSRWLQACTIDELLSKLGMLVDAYLYTKEMELHNDF